MKAFIQHSNPDSDKKVLQALVPFMELCAHAIFTQKASTTELSNKKTYQNVEANAEYYQRWLDSNKVNDIQEYIYNAILDEKENLAVNTLFPTALVIAYQTDNEYISDENGLCDFDLNDRIYIVDGQHRVMAMKLLYENLANLEHPCDDDKFVLEYLKKYKFSCTVLINFDLWEQGQVFVNVNFKQKPVNKSLFYDVYGSEYPENRKDWKYNKIYIAHIIIENLNNLPQSPFYKKIKMLGTGSGYISQAFFVEAILPFFKEDGIWYVNDVTKNENGEVTIKYLSELLSFYVAISEMLKNFWGVDKFGKTHLLCKTTGVGAFVRLLPIIRKNAFNKEALEFSENDLSINKLYCDEVKRILNGLLIEQNRLFGPDSKYKGTGGKGLESALFKEITNILIVNGTISKDTLPQKKQSYANTKTTNLDIRKQLSQQGISDIEETLCDYLNSNLPSEIDALGNHCRVEDVNDVSINSVWQAKTEGDLIVSGSCECVVNIALEREEDATTTSRFPAEFTLCVGVKPNGKCDVVGENNIFSVDTDEYYR